MNRAIGLQLVVNNEILGRITGMYKEGQRTYIQVDDSYEIEVSAYAEYIDLMVLGERLEGLEQSYIKAKLAV